MTKIAIHDPANAELKKKLIEALTKIGEVDPEGLLIDALAGKKPEHVLTAEDHERIARAEAKRKRRAQRNMERERD